MEMTKEHISFTFDPRDILISLQMSLSFVKAAVAFAVLERISGLEPSSETTAPWYLNALLFLALFVISLVFSALISILYLVKVLWTLSTRASSSCSSSAEASMSSANRRFGNISATYANLPIIFFQGIRHDPFEKNVEEGG